MRLTCSSSPRGPIQWARVDDRPLHPVPESCALTSRCAGGGGGEGVLMVEGVRGEDAGHYLCTARLQNQTAAKVCTVVVGGQSHTAIDLSLVSHQVSVHHCGGRSVSYICKHLSLVSHRVSLVHCCGGRSVSHSNICVSTSHWCHIELVCTVMVGGSSHNVSLVSHRVSLHCQSHERFIGVTLIMEVTMCNHSPVL